MDTVAQRKKNREKDGKKERRQERWKEIKNRITAQGNISLRF